MSSPVFTTTVTSAGGTARTRPRRNFPAPIPPANATTLGMAASLPRLPLTPCRRRFGPTMTEATHVLRRSLARARSGKALSVDEAEALLGSRGEALEDLLRIAAGLRDRGHGQTITYSRKVFIPLTMLCRDHCHY